MFKFLLLILGFNLLIFINGQAQYVTTIAGTGIFGDSGDGGQALSANITFPQSVAFDSVGNMYIAEDFLGSSLSFGLRKVNKQGIISTVVKASVFPVLNVFADKKSNIYVSSGQMIKKLDSTGKLSTFAGGGSYTGSLPTKATNVDLYIIQSMAFDNNGNVYIGDNYRVMKVDKNGILSTLAGIYGTFGYSGDGLPAANALFKQVTGLALDKNGNLYIADHGNHVVRKIDTSGIISTVIGNGVIADTGNGGLAINASMGYPYGLAFDKKGNLFISDDLFNVIRKVDALGIISRYAGGNNTSATIDGPALLSRFDTPTGLNFDTLGNLYVADYGNNLIRKISTTNLPVDLKIFSVEWFKTSNGNTMVKWETVSEVNVDHFNIQRSEDGVTFETIGTVKAKGAGKYSLTPNPSPLERGATCYYRLEVVDKNGALSYSEVKEVRFDNGGLMISPNPAKDYVTISGGNIKEVIIRDANGRVLLIGKEKRVDIRSLSAGIYYITIEGIEGGRLVRKFVKI